MGSLRPVGILGIGVYLPEKVMTNEDFTKIVDTSDEWIVTRSGIRERRFAAADQATSDLAAQAALKALEASGTKAEEIELIIVGTVSPDHSFPSTACLVQDKIGAKNAGAFDLAAACSGFVYGLVVGAQFISCGLYQKVLVIGAETLSRFLDFKDRATCVLMGDGAGAAVLGPVAEGKGILSMSLGADGSSGDILKIPAGGSRIPATHGSVDAGQHYIYMNGREVFKAGVRQFEQSIREVVEQAGLTLDDVSMIVPHQANIRIISAVAERLGISMDRVALNLEKYGNMSAASIPVALHEAVQDGKIRDGDLIVLVAFGGGLTWGSLAIRW